MGCKQLGPGMLSAGIWYPVSHKHFFLKLGIRIQLQGSVEGYVSEENGQSKEMICLGGQQWVCGEASERGRANQERSKGNASQS